MSISINSFRNQLTSREILTASHLCAIKGGDGEDIRNRCAPPPPPPAQAAAPATHCAAADTTKG
jgi:hypothetical protein